LQNGFAGFMKQFAKLFYAKVKKKVAYHTDMDNISANQKN